MKLKLVVASMSILGLISCPAFATNAKKKHHHKMMKQQMTQRDYKDYKDMGNMQPAPQVCTVPASDMRMAEMTQNLGRSLPNPCNPGWFNRIMVSGGLNIDIGHWGNRNAGMMGENYQAISLNDAYLNVGAMVNDWTTAFASLSFSNPTTNVNPSVFNSFGAAEYSAAYSNNINGNANNLVQLEQAYATLGNFDVTPLFLQVGKQFQDFGRYEIHPITASLTQVMSEVLSTSIKLGFLYSGFHGSVYAFNDPINKVGQSTRPTNYGAALGYDQINDQLGFDLGVAYLYNIIGANDVAYSVVNFTGSNYNSHVGGYALYADVNSGPFTIGARWTSVSSKFNVNDMPQSGNKDLTATSAAIGSGTAVTPTGTATGARPWALGVQAGYGFDVWSKNQNIYVGYQSSSQAAGLNLPQSRWLAGYNIDVWKSQNMGTTNLGLEWDHDNAFSRGSGGSGNVTNLISLRAAVAFS
ncbi:MAG TPA: LbtU family siderophore porin [Gammaproteobacteria bacterium]|nr:LbtU family siderophore porin [Gammaproteobacteria bacterium]